MLIIQALLIAGLIKINKVYWFYAAPVYDMNSIVPLCVDSQPLFLQPSKAFDKKL